MSEYGPVIDKLYREWLNTLSGIRDVQEAELEAQRELLSGFRQYGDANRAALAERKVLFLEAVLNPEPVEEGVTGNGEVL